MSEMLEAAIRYAARGWPIIPLHSVVDGKCTCGKSGCSSQGKHPRTRNGKTDASTDQDRIRSWWLRWPDANIGVVCDTITAIDCDPRHGSEGTLADWSDRFGGLPKTLTQITPSGGQHFIYEQHESVGNSAGKAGDGIDTRGRGDGYIVAAPSIGIGGSYRWVDESIEIARVPDWFVGLLSGSKVAPLPPTPSAPLAPGGRVRAYMDKVDGACEGGRNDATYRAAAILCNDFVLPKAEALDILLEWNRAKNAPALPDVEVAACLESAVRNPKRGIGAKIEEESIITHSQKLPETKPKKNKKKITSRPEFKKEWVDIPGPISDIVAHTLSHSAVKNRISAFVGALAICATFLRKAQYLAEGDTRSNIYAVCLARSSFGKNAPRITNDNIMRAMEARACSIEHASAFVSPDRCRGMIAETFASAQGIASALMSSPCATVLFQPDELDKLMSRWAKGNRDSQADAIQEIIMKLYSSSTGTYYSDRRADQSNNYEIRCPHACLLGTATTHVFFEALAGATLRNGMPGRMIVFEAEGETIRPGIREARNCGTQFSPLSESTLDWFWYWMTLLPVGSGNLSIHSDVNEPIVRVEDTTGAVDIMDEYGRIAQQRVAHCSKGSNDGPGIAIWGRFCENRNKLAMIRACTENKLNPVITDEIARWACEIAEYSANLQIYMIDKYSSDNNFDASMKKVLRVINDAAGAWVHGRDIYRAERIRKREVEEVVETLEAQGLVEKEVFAYRGRASFRVRAINE